MQHPRNLIRGALPIRERAGLGRGHQELDRALKHRALRHRGKVLRQEGAGVAPCCAGGDSKSLDGLRQIPAPQWGAGSVHSSRAATSLEAATLSIARYSSFSDTALSRSASEAAVFEAFKTVEIAIREAAELPEHEHGRPMVAKAFKADGGTLTDAAEHIQEREALQMFASGAVGYFKTHAAIGGRI